jgi:hypothetical protein
MPSFANKINEWIKEAEARPESALTIVRLIAKRLNDLTDRNEELLAENIALQNGTRVEEYQRRIAHLEYQLDLLKRRFDLDDNALLEQVADSEGTTALNLLVYNAYGRVLRIEVEADVQALGRITDEMVNDREPPRLLGVPSNEEVLFLFTSGRVSTHAIGGITSVEPGGEWSWEQAPLPDEPRAGEWLACIMPLSVLPLSDFFLQISRRGCVKKTMTSMAQSILTNTFLGRGALQKSDQPFEVMLCKKGERIAFVTYEGHLLGLEVDELSYGTEERIRIPASDYVVASFPNCAGEPMLFVTQTGKVVHRESDHLEVSKSPLAKGQALIPHTRLEQGVRFVGAVTARDEDRIVVLDAAGMIRLHSAGSITGAGSTGTDSLILSIGKIPAQSRELSNL